MRKKVRTEIKVESRGGRYLAGVVSIIAANTLWTEILDSCTVWINSGFGRSRNTTEGQELDHFLGSITVLVENDSILY
jgi:hypothetical protein